MNENEKTDSIELAKQGSNGENVSGNQVPDRRRFLKAGALAMGGVAAYSRPLIARADPGRGGSPVPPSLPYHFQGIAPQGPHTMALSGSANSIYNAVASGTLDIDADGNIVCQNGSITATFVSGDNVGTITLTQTGATVGKLSGTSFNATGTGTYQDNLGSQAVSCTLSGFLAATGCAVDVEVDVQTGGNRTSNTNVKTQKNK